MQLRKELDDEDRRVAESQGKITNGIYHYADADVAKARKVRLQDGRRLQIGEQCDFDIVGKRRSASKNLASGFTTSKLPSATSRGTV